jgi:hypothetical protein
MMSRTAPGRRPRPASAPQFQVYTNRQFAQISELQCLTPEQSFDIEVVARVLP